MNMTRRWHSVSKHKRSLKNGSPWYLYWRDADGKQRAEAAGTDSHWAETRRHQIEAEINDPHHHPIRPITLAEFSDEHMGLVASELAPATVAEHRAALDRLKVFVGPAHLDTITHSVMERFRAALAAEELSPYTVNKILRTLDSILQRATDREYLWENPCAKIKKLREPERPHRHLSPKEVEALLAACPNSRWRAFLFLAAITGARKGELQHLRWKDLDLDRGIAHIVCTPNHSTKTAKNRDVVLVPRAIAYLKAMISPGTIPVPSSTAFLNEVGQPMLHNTNRALKSIVARAGIPHCTFHDLRRSITVYMDPHDAMTLLGHDSITTTLQWYKGRATQEALTRAVNALPWATRATPETADRLLTRPVYGSEEKVGSGRLSVVELG